MRAMRAVRVVEGGRGSKAAIGVGGEPFKYSYLRKQSVRRRAGQQ